MRGRRGFTLIELLVASHDPRDDLILIYSAFSGMRLSREGSSA